MNWFEPRDEYCERLGPGLWAEPLNAVSNAAFILAGLYMLWRSLRQGRDAWVEIMCLWVVAIGIGSTLYHTFANRWSELADVIPIWTFVLAYLVFVLRRLYGLGPWRVLRVIAITVAVTAAIVYALPQGTREATNGSVQYLPAIVALFGFALAHWLTHRPGAGWVLAAAATFCMSLGFRSLDMALCDQWAHGTHFAWHILNGVMLGLLLKVVVDHGRAARVRPPSPA